MPHSYSNHLPHSPLCTPYTPALRRYNSSGQVNLRFEAGYDGVLRFDKAEVRARIAPCTLCVVVL